MPVKKLYFCDSTQKSLYIKKFDKLVSSCQILQEKKMALIGISLGNSYFNEDRLKLILSGFGSYFENVAVVLVDDLAMHNYIALGYTEQRAKKKIKINSNNTRNKIKNIIEELERKNITFYKWKEVEESSAYHKSVAIITEYYNNDNDFSSEINQATLSVLSKYISDSQIEKAVLDEAKWYLLKELAFIHSACEFFNSPLLNCYYTDFPLIRNILSKYNITEQDMIIYECEE